MFLVRLDNIPMNRCTKELLGAITSAIHASDAGPRRIGLAAEEVVFAASRHLPGTAHIVVISVEARGDTATFLDDERRSDLAKTIARVSRVHFARYWRIHVTVAALAPQTALYSTAGTAGDHASAEKG